MITFTEPAIAKLVSQLKKRGKGVGIRIGVKTTGCSGLAYVLEYVDEYVYEESVINFSQKDYYNSIPIAYTVLLTMNIFPQ